VTFKDVPRGTLTLSLNVTITRDIYVTSSTLLLSSGYVMNAYC